MASIEDVRSLEKDVQKSWLWEVEINNALTSIFPDEDITLYAQEVQLPEQSVEQIALNHKGIATYFRGRDASDHTLTITFFDSEKMEVYSYFKLWLDIFIQNAISGGGFNKELYTSTINVRTQEANEESETAEWKFTLAWPMELGSVNLSYDSEEAFTFEVTFSFDGFLYGN